jgi:hypothetical protein
VLDTLEKHVKERSHQCSEEHPGGQGLSSCMIVTIPQIVYGGCDADKTTAFEQFVLKRSLHGNDDPMLALPTQTRAETVLFEVNLTLDMFLHYETAHLQESNPL